MPLNPRGSDGSARLLPSRVQLDAPWGMQGEDGHKFVDLRLLLLDNALGNPHQVPDLLLLELHNKTSRGKQVRGGELEWRMSQKVMVAQQQQQQPWIAAAAAASANVVGPAP